MNNQKRNIQILISCDCQGRLEQIVNKVTSLQAKQTFDFMLLAGDVCHPRSSSFIHAIRNQSIIAPLPMYFIDDSQMSPVLHKLHPHGFQIHKNFIFLGSHGIFKVKDITIAYFSHNAVWENKSPQKQQIDQFLNMCRGRKIDILMTNKWPNEVKQISGKLNAKCANFISTLASQINPHYHIAAGSDSFYRMSPYANSNQLLTHFISVAPFEENTKEKYLFGLTLRPGLQQMAKGDNILQNPYHDLKEKQQNNEINGTNLSMKSRINQKGKETQINLNSSTQYLIHFEGFPDWARDSDITQFLQRWGNIKTVQCKKELAKGSRCGYVKYQDSSSMQNCLQSSQKVFFQSTRIKFSRIELEFKKRNQDCWFCKQKGDEQLIIYKGKYCYLSLEKGPINKFHMQIIPYNHIQNTGKLEMVQREELDQILTIIKSHFIGTGYEVVIYERYLPLSQSINHCVLHLIPFKSSNQNTFLLQSKFEKLNISDNLGFKVDRGERRNTQHYIKLNFNNKFYIKDITKRDRVQADYMRVILGELIGNARVANWKQCQRSQGELLQQRRNILLELKQSGLIS